MSVNLNRRVLLIAPRYFGYEKEIEGELRRQGALVDVLPDRPFDSAFLKAATRFRPEITARHADYFYVSELERLGRRHYDVVLIIQGECVTSHTLRLLRTTFTGARLVFYTWDSLENKPFVLANIGLYDDCLSFDPADAALHGMRPRPLFFSVGFERDIPATCTFDISFIGTIHSDRYRIVKCIADSLPANIRTFWYLYLQAPWMYEIRKVFTHTIKNASKDEFQFLPMTKAAVQDVFLTSKSVLDIEHPKQRGLTMRTIEAVGSKTKLVTTNTAVRQYDFFNESNICVIDRANPQMAGSFLESPYSPVSEAIYDGYRLSSWVADVTGTRAYPTTSFKPVRSVDNRPY